MKLPIRDFVAAQTHMMLSVVLENEKPWTVPVKIDRVQDGRFEWLSKTETAHSQAIKLNPNVMICLYDRTVEEKSALYLEAVAELSGEEENSLVRYSAKVIQAWLNDESHIKREIQLKELI